MSEVDYKLLRRLSLAMTNKRSCGHRTWHPGCRICTALNQKIRDSMDPLPWGQKQ